MSCLLGYLDYAGEAALIKSTDAWIVLFLSVNKLTGVLVHCSVRMILGLVSRGLAISGW